jgi:S-DNA-T family DNA segregation ATPase FtsK/SpoIIIE
MARTGVRPRSSPKPRGVRSAPSRSARPRVGRKRRDDTFIDVFIAWLLRVESVGLGLAVSALALAAVLLGIASAPNAVQDIVRAVGVGSLGLVLALAGLGYLVWRRDLGLVARYPRLVLAIAPGLLFVLGLASLVHADSKLAGIALSEVTPGGDAGDFLTSSVLGVLAWLACGIAFLATAWPRSIELGARHGPVVASTVWGWGIPGRVMAGIAAIVEFAFPTKPPIDEQPQHIPPSWLPPEREPIERFEVEPPAEEQPPPGPARQVGLPMEWKDEEAPPAPLPASSFGWTLPPMDMLASGPAADAEIAKPDNNARAALIVETLASFGVDARVVQVNEGPTVTQFGIEPGWDIKYRQVAERDREGKPIVGKDGKPVMRQEEVSRTRVRVNEITRLQNDLALALAAPSIRIEAPVPGKAVIGVEVPNSAASVVTLRSVIETPAFQRLAAKSKLALALGKSVSGEAVVADLTKMPHLLIAGATGSGKSVCINSIVSCILMHAKPEEVRFVMVDPKRVELSSFAMIPHLAFSSIIVDVEKVVGTLGAVIQEMEARYKRFAALAVRNIDAYNKHPKVHERMPYWVVIIDELADLMMAAPFEVERQICRLAQLARATGIHLIVATQRPSVDVITGLIKANFPTRIAFAVTSQVDSRTIIDGAGAERLLGRGDMLFMPTDASKPKRVQGVYVGDQEIDRIVNFWAEERSRTGNATPVYDHLLEEAMDAIEEEEDGDPMFERAKALAVEHNRISTSMLQRRLRIGYPRAARLIDMLEEEGVVGPAGPGGSRDVIDSGIDRGYDGPLGDDDDRY